VRQFFRDYFLFNRRERNGTLVLLSIMLILIGVLTYLHNDVVNVNEKDSFRIQELTEEEEPHDQLRTMERKREEWKEVEPKRVPVQYFYFDPNTLGSEGWLKLGLSEKQTRIILNYVMKGGHFRKAADLKKIYGLSTKQDSLLEPYIRIPAEIKNKKDSVVKWVKSGSDTQQVFHRSGNKLKAGELLNLNEADSAMLVRLPCIGPTFAKRILSYRERLGGYAEKAQLLEVFGMDEERYACFVSNISLGQGVTRKLKINKATPEELKSHPYIRWNLAKSIVNYRLKHGPFKSIEELKSLELIDEEFIKRIKPYVSFE
jgi:competence protein ComEA